MDTKQLRQLIREEVESALDEAEKATEQPPKTFAEFRKQLAAALKKAGAPKDLASEVADVDNEGGGVVEPLWTAWTSIEQELRQGPVSSAEWEDLVSFYVHDCVIDVASEYKNSMNYGPGRKAKPIDASGLAASVVAAMAGGKVKKPNALLDIANLVIDVLEGSRAVKGVKWDGKSDKVTYRVMRSDYLELIYDQAVKAGFEPDMNNEDLYRDSQTGASIRFGDGVATIRV